MQRGVVIRYRLFGAIYLSSFQWPRNPGIFWVLPYYDRQAQTSFTSVRKSEITHCVMFSRPLGLQEVEAPRIRHMTWHGCQPYATLPPRRYLETESTPRPQCLLRSALTNWATVCRYVRWRAEYWNKWLEFDVLLEIIDFMLIIVQYQQLAVTKRKCRYNNTADSCYKRAVIWQLLKSRCYWSEYSQNFISRAHVRCF